MNDSDGRVNLGELLLSTSSQSAFYSYAELTPSSLYNLEQKTPDYSAAFKVFSEAVKQGHVYAQYRVGEMMVDGMGTQKNCPAGVAVSICYYMR